MKKTKYRSSFEQLTTPTGIAVYPRLNEPDTKFDKDGVYSVDLRLDSADPASSEFLKTLSESAERSYQSLCEEHGGKKLKKAALPIKNDKPWDEEEAEGSASTCVLVKFKLKAKAGNDVKSWAQRPLIYDALGNPYDPVPMVGSGSEIRVAFQVVPYFTAMVGAGVSLRLKAVQVLKLVEFSPGNSFVSFGFKADPESSQARTSRASAQAASSVRNFGSDSDEAKNEDVDF